MGNLDDAQLMARLPHLQAYPSYLPYIGPGYASAPLKILIVAESHYLHRKYDGQITEDSWYDDPVAVTHKIKDNLSGINTRKVIQDYRTANRTLKAYRIFLNLEAAYRDVFPGRELFHECAFINYFQRPAERNGQSIKVGRRDAQVAFENLTGLAQVIGPHKVVFTSRKAFDAYKASQQQIDYTWVNVIPHPSCVWWNKPSPRYGLNGLAASGRDKFIRLLK